MIELIKNKQLIQNQLFINNEWLDAESGNTFIVKNPFDQSELTEVSDCGPVDTQAAIEAASNALGLWKILTAGERSAILRKWFNLIIKNQEDLATLLTLEQGKPLMESRGEIAYGASFIEWFAEEAKRIYGDTIPGHQENKRIIVLKLPVGVVAALTPWNFPNAMITRKVAPALAVGCSVVIKPAEDTPLSALALAQLAKEAGFPPGVINVVPTSNPGEVGEVLTSSPKVKKLSFTGSTAVGKLLMKQCAGTVKKLSLELGGNAPFIVFNDSDIEKAVQGAIASKYRNAGQTCVCANRIFVQEAIYDQFLAQFTSAVKGLKTGSGLEKVEIGPLINQKALDKVNRLLQDAEQKGGKVLEGGKLAIKDTTLFKPTVLADATAEMDISQEEVFGPVAPVYKFNTVQEVIEMANDTSAGLAAYFYGNNNRVIWQVAEELEYGMGGINTGMISTAVAPFGGIKESGFGREGSKYGIEDYLVTKYLCLEV